MKLPYLSAEKDLTDEHAARHVWREIKAYLDFIHNHNGFTGPAGEREEVFEHRLEGTVSRFVYDKDTVPEFRPEELYRKLDQAVECESRALGKTAEETAKEKAQRHYNLHDLFKRHLTELVSEEDHEQAVMYEDMVAFNYMIEGHNYNLRATPKPIAPKKPKVD